MLDIRAEHDRGMAYLESGDLGPALAALRTVITAIPGNEEVSRALRRLARSAGNGALGQSLDSVAAIELYKWSLEAYLAIGQTITDPVDTGLLRVVSFNLGAHYHRLGRFPEAIRHYQDAIILGPEHEDTPNNLAEVLTDAGRPLEALEVVEAALRYHPDSANLRYRKDKAREAAGLTKQKVAPEPASRGPR
jgi:tetratricopeptide (TPR) repeat protein